MCCTCSYTLLSVKYTHTAFLFMSGEYYQEQAVLVRQCLLWAAVQSKFEQIIFPGITTFYSSSFHLFQWCSAACLSKGLLQKRGHPIPSDHSVLWEWLGDSTISADGIGLPFKRQCQKEDWKAHTEKTHSVSYSLSLAKWPHSWHSTANQCVCSGERGWSR